VFALLRGESASGRVLCLQNVTGETQLLSRDAGTIFSRRPSSLVDLVGGQTLDARLGLELSPYQTLWLHPS
jgi:hypothetical protein